MASTPASTPPQSGAAGSSGDGYNTGLQIMAIFLIWAFSTAACAFPVAVKRFSRIKVPRHTLFICRHLGTGVILATCFVHLVPTAFENLHAPALPKFWTEDYPAMPGLIMLVAVIIMGALESLFASRKLGHSHHSDLTDLDTVPRDSREDEEAGQTADGEQRPAESEKGDAEAQRYLMQCALLEAGILFHSIFIGMAIAFSRDAQFVVLLIAISFHQIFEGLALGSRIAAIEKFAEKSFKPWGMALAYGVTAPLGQAIGLAVHGTFDLDSPKGFLMVGLANAFSSGLLIYAGLIQLFYEDFLSEHGQKQLRGRKVSAWVAFLVGAAAMSVIGAWA